MTIQPKFVPAQPYPKKHLIAASGIAAAISLILLVFPSKQVEATRMSPALPVEKIAAQKASGKKAAAMDFSSSLPEDMIQPQSITIQVRKGDTLSTIFEQLGIGNSIMQTMLSSHKEAASFAQKIRPDQEIEFHFADNGNLEGMSSQISQLENISIMRKADSNTFAFTKHVQKPVQVQAVATGTIHSSLLASTSAAGLPHKLALNMANAFRYDIDFAKDVHPGDSFEVVYEKKMVDDQVVGTGNILAARFINKGKTLTTIRYTNKYGQTAYYNSNGTGKQNAFIRTPVDFTRISSKFNPGRRHPVLNKIRAHKGVDYAAPTGTPIKATGNGTISFLGNKNGYGKTVIIQHGSTYRTLYGHMNGYAKGLKSGSLVKQGQVIGYVGMTGLATGPHLHYEFHVNGQHIDPLSHKLPVSDPLSGAELANFNKVAKPYLAMLDTHKSQLALADTQ